MLMVTNFTSSIVVIILIIFIIASHRIKSLANVQANESCYVMCYSKFDQETFALYAFVKVWTEWSLTRT